MGKAGRLSLLSVAIALIVVTAFGAGYAVANRFPVAAAQAEAPVEAQKDFQVFWEVWSRVRDDFVDQSRVQTVPLTRGAIRGMLAALNDKHTVYVDPDHYKLERADFQGKFGGIGAQVTVENGFLTIIRPIENSPAEKAGIRAGDKILKIDGQDAAGLTLPEAVNRIRGPEGTTVLLIVLRSGDTDPVEIAIVRGEVENPSVTFDEPAPGIARIRIRSFGQKTEEEVKRALRERVVRDARGLILDLRNNPGGLLDATVKITGEFLDQGLILAQEDGDGKRRVWNDEPGGLATTIPIVILINGGSASGSEVLAGALRDHGRAKLIGEKTFGKGSVNHIFELSDGGALYVTFARWRTPNGHLIEDQGLQPDLEVKLTPEIERAQGDSQLQRAIDELRAG